MDTQILIKAAVAACLVAGLTASSLARPKKMKYIPDGVWGAQHIRVQVEKGSATIEYDCAHGTITGPLKVDSKGRFSLLGTHVGEHGGPTREGEDQRGSPARYSGWTDGRTMKLTVTLVGSNDSVGTYTLTRGQSGRVFKCK
jgi:hypothetical protein